MIVRDPETREFVGIGCDGCGKSAPSVVEIKENHGLHNMGWHCSGGLHLCPDHDHPADGWPRRTALPVLKAGG